MDHNESNFAYVAWAWDMVCAQKEIPLDHQIPTDPPTGWETVKNEILSFRHDNDSTCEAAGHGKTGLFIVVSDERRYFPLSLQQRNTASAHLLCSPSLLEEFLSATFCNSHSSTATNARPLLTSFISARSTGDRSTESTRNAIRGSSRHGYC